MLIVIDGPAGVGKSTVSKKLAEKLHCDFFDTGAMYRAATLFLLENSDKCSLNDEMGVKLLLKNFNFDIVSKNGEKRYLLNGRDVSKEIRSLEVTAAVSTVSAKGFVREELVKIQRSFARQKDALFEGRDMGSVVFPNADLKFFLTAKAKIRAQRRYDELLKKGENVPFKKILEDINKRDEYDSNRKISPLRKAEDAILVDTSHLGIEEVVQKLYAHYLKKIKRSRPHFLKMKPFYALCLFLIWAFLKVFYRMQVFYPKNFIKGKAIIAANHASYLDPPAVATSSLEEIHFLAKPELFKIPVLNFIIRRLNSHPIAGSGRDASTFKKVAALLKEEKKILLFPEGERSFEGKLGKILPGVGFLAYLSKAPIIPCYVQGTHSIWPRSKKLPHLFGKIKVAFGKPIRPENFAGLDRHKALEKISLQLENSLKELQALLEKNSQKKLS